MPSYCPDCGKELINPNAEICPTCGGRLKPTQTAALVTAAPVTAAPVTAAPVTAAPINQRSPVVAAILSVIVCGLGQIYNGQLAKGIVYFIIAVICGLLIIAVIGIILLPIWWIIGIIDAYKTAEKINANVDASGFFNLS
jgi:TM2 domain-containing membrane protein YozV